MKRSYYKEPGTGYGRPKTKTASRPPDFRSYDDEMQGWDLRHFRVELVRRQREANWERDRPEWEKQNVTGTPITDLGEIDRFLVRPPSIALIRTQEDADHALKLGMVLIAVDPNTPNLMARLKKQAEEIRASHPLPIKRGRGRPSGATNVAGISEKKVREWRSHRIVALHALRLKGYDPHKERKQLAEWMFPDIKDRRSRGRKLDRAVELLDDALAALGVIAAQTR
jgi:hypothetical protein